ncbi:type I-E CRISPR-associated protein Cas7/Cse4/CasC [Aquimonas sp.]|jgi:CRISPR system Cascade subunit CasC|uniref:type I-E CRISPR-associated protein Cas7/Cse4/CasC n=1 Tax=Aquimonas sp. TaxID=1872588 RepID=UPI0037BF90F6
MSRFIQLHALTSYPPSNLNRDDLGRPKSAIVGGSQRLRVSSQALKRAWRTSESFRAALDGNLGTRTKEMGVEVFKQLVAAGVAEKQARVWARAIAGCFGKSEAEKKPESDKKSEGENKAENFDDLYIAQLAHFGPEEIHAIHALVATLSAEQRAPQDDELKLLREPKAAVDIALFGRMLASSPAFNVDAAAQVAHAITVHKATVEDDYFTAVDDLNRGDEDRGAGHIGETGFGSGIYYLYVCIDLELLDSNLGGDVALRNRALAALVQAIAQVAPTGKQNSFASRAHASCVLGERGGQQPRSLHLAYLRPDPKRVGDDDMAAAAIRALRDKRDSLEQMYGPSCNDWRAAVEGEYRELLGEHAGSLAELVAFLQAD